MFAIGVAVGAIAGWLGTMAHNARYECAHDGGTFRDQCCLGCGLSQSRWD
jgi:hypothetical protein